MWLASMPRTHKPLSEIRNWAWGRNSFIASIEERNWALSFGMSSMMYPTTFVAEMLHFLQTKNEEPNSHYDIANVLLYGIVHLIVFLCRIRVLLLQSGRCTFRYLLCRIRHSLSPHDDSGCHTVPGTRIQYNETLRTYKRSAYHTKHSKCSGIYRRTNARWTAVDCLR